MTAVIIVRTIITAVRGFQVQMDTDTDRRLQTVADEYNIYIFLC